MTQCLIPQLTIDRPTPVCCNNDEIHSCVNGQVAFSSINLFTNLMHTVKPHYKEVGYNKTLL